MNLKELWNKKIDEQQTIVDRCKAEKRDVTNSEKKRFEELQEEIDFLQDQEEPVNLIRPTGTGNRGVTQGFKSFGEQLQSVIQAATPGASIDSRLSIKNAASGLSGVPSDGGFLVQTDFSTKLLQRTYETGILAGKCFKMPISTNANSIKINAVDETSRATGSRLGGIRGYWQGEAKELEGSKPEFRQMELSLKKLTGLCYATDELLQDAAALESIIMKGFAEEFGFLVDDAIIRGTGVGKPLGILNSDALVTVAKEGGQAAKSILAENIINMYSRCSSESKANWYINRDVLPQLFTMSLPVGTGGAPIFMPAGGISGSPYNTLLGRSIIPMEQCSTLGTVGDIIFADFGEYIWSDKGDIDAAASIHVRFLYDEQVFRFIYRCEGQPGWKSALTPYKGTNTISPFVALAARA